MIFALRAVAIINMAIGLWSFFLGDSAQAAALWSLAACLLVMANE